MSMIHPDFNITLEDELDGPSWVKMYRNHLEQVMIILIDNAVKYSKDRKEIHVSLGNNEVEVSLAIQDFGEGISPENMSASSAASTGSTRPGAGKRAVMAWVWRLPSS
nr:ATP-binding protein [Lacticaseibacillus sharpeae]